LGWRNQRLVWRNFLRTILHIEICADDDFVAVTIECGVKCRISIIGGIKKQIESDEARTRCKTIDPAKAPRVRVTTGTAARSAIAVRLAASSSGVNGGNCNVLDRIPRKTKIARRGWSSGPRGEANLQALFAAPRHRYKRGSWKELPNKKSDPSKKDRSASALNTRARPNHSMGGFIPKNKCRMAGDSETLKVRGHAAIFLFTSHQTSHYFYQHA